MRSRLCARVRVVALIAVAFAGLAAAQRAAGDTFGSGANTFDVELAVIGNPGNPDDNTGSPNPAGAVPYTYRIGKFEISEQMIVKANALGALGITKDSRGADKPATSVSWNEAARFVNWLNTSTGGTAAYKFAVQPGQTGYNPNAPIQLWMPGDPGYDPANVFRNSLARYVLPSTHEWYKAAYYDSSSDSYFDFPTASNTAPTPVLSGTTAGTAVYNQTGFQTGPADVAFAGGLSPYGTMGQGGNVWEWQESNFNLPNAFSTSREIRGGNWGTVPSGLASSARATFSADSGDVVIGFRIASVPEPGSALLAALAVTRLMLCRKRGPGTLRKPEFLKGDFDELEC